MFRPTLRRATCRATMLQRRQRACEARRSPERAASINSVESGRLACSSSRACRCVTHLQNTQNCRKSNGCIEGRPEWCAAPGKRVTPHTLRRRLATECVGRFFFGKSEREPTSRRALRGAYLTRASRLSSSCSLRRGQRHLCAQSLATMETTAASADQESIVQRHTRARAVAGVKLSCSFPSSRLRLRSARDVASRSR